MKPNNILPHHSCSENFDLDSEINLLLDIVSSVSEFNFESSRNNLESLKQRLCEGQFHLAVVGQFKRGKSSFLNAMLGMNVLPVSVVPLTSVPVFIRHAESKYAEVFLDGRNSEYCESEDPEELCSFLSGFVSEEENPENHLGVTSVDLYLDSQILQNEIILIDTPGIGSTHRHNTETTLDFLSQCDAALFVLSPDPPVTEAEIDFLENVKSNVSHLFFVLNKIDTLTDAEQEPVISFNSRVLEKKAGIDKPEIFPVSARVELKNRFLEESSDPSESGMGYILSRIKAFAGKEKKAVLVKSISSGTAEECNHILMQINLVIKSFALPHEELEARLHIFDNAINNAENQKIFMEDNISGERKRLQEYLYEQSKKLRMVSYSYLDSIVNNYIETKTVIRENEIRRLIADAIPVFFEEHLQMMSEQFNDRVYDLLSVHYDHIDSICNTVRKAASEIFDIPYHPSDKIQNMDFSNKPCWVSFQLKSSFVPVPPEFFDFFFTENRRAKRIKSRIDREIKILVMRNVESLRWSTLQNLDETFRKYLCFMNKSLSDTISATRGAILKADKRCIKYKNSVNDEIKTLESLALRVSNIKENLSKNNRLLPKASDDEL